MKRAMALHLAYALAAFHLVHAIAVDKLRSDVILLEPLPLIPGPEPGSWSPASEPYADSLEQNSDVILPEPQFPLIPGPDGTWPGPSSSAPYADSLEQASSDLYDYSDGPNGPEHWGDLKPEWSLCKSGARQSPLAITPNLMVTDRTLGDLKATYTSTPVDVTVSHHDLELKVIVPPEAGELKISNITYRPVSFHFHRPSEHRILNYSFPLELHLVHKSEDDRIAVIAWLFIPGSSNNSFLAQFLDKLPTHKNPYSSLKIPRIKLPALEPNYGRYRGSLTTPPCSEPVIWTVMLWNFPSVSDYQLKQIKAAMPKKNARPSFPSRGRKFRINHTLNWTSMEQAFKDYSTNRESSLNM